ncbi:MAG: hypothetical protein KF893_06080 [Caldilineaceae bacterium]|nr:hypothetical protein [Caldilineaceae bacterium]
MMKATIAQQQPDMATSSNTLISFGPLLAAGLLTWKESGRNGLRQLIRHMFQWRVSPIWWLAAISPLLVYVLTMIVLWVIQGQPMDVRSLGQLNFLSNLGLAALPF